MHPPGADTVVVRHGEVGTNSYQVRRAMEGRLHDTLRALLAHRDIESDREWERDRLYVHADDTSDETATEAVPDAFGVVSASPPRPVDPTLGRVREALAETPRVRYDVGSFAVRARRAGAADDHAFTSEDVEERGGEAVWNAVAFDPGR